MSTRLALSESQAAVAIAFVVALGVAALISTRLDIGGDYRYYFQIAQRVGAGQIPYRDFPVAYPPLALVPILLPTLSGVFGVLTPELYRLGLLAENLAFITGTALCVGALAARGWSARSSRATVATYTLLAVASPSIFWRFDAFPALLTALGLLLLAFRRPTLSGVSLGAAILAKLYAIALLPVVAATEWIHAGRRSASALVTLAALTVASVFLPLSLLGASISSVVVYQQTRGLEIESVQAGVVLLANLAGLTDAHAEYAFESWQLSSALGGPVAVVTGAVISLLFLVLLAAGIRAFRVDVFATGTVRAATMLQYCTAALLFILLANKTLSASYMIWLLPLAALADRRTTIGIAVASGLTLFVFPLGWNALIRLEPGAILLLNTRNLVLGLVFGGLIARDARAVVASVASRFRVGRTHPTGSLIEPERRVRSPVQLGRDGGLGAPAPPVPLPDLPSIDLPADLRVGDEPALPASSTPLVDVPSDGVAQEADGIDDRREQALGPVPENVAVSPNVDGDVIASFNDWIRPAAIRLNTALGTRVSVRWLIVIIVLVSLISAVVAARFSGLNGPWLWNYDMLPTNYPWAAFFHQALQQGRLPMWQDSLGMGQPLYAVGQVGALYPPHWLIYQLPPLVAIDISRIVHLTIAGIGAGLITLRLSGSRLGSLATAVVAVLCGGILGKLEWTEVVVAYAWIPWVLLPLFWHRTGPSAKAVALAAIPWGIQALAGYPQTWVYTAVCAAVVILFRQRNRRGLVHVALFGLLGVGLGAVQLIPTAVLTALSTRAAGMAPGDLFQYSATPFDFLGLGFANAYMPLQGSYADVIRTWYPGGHWATLEVYSYVGLPALAFVALGVGVRRARPLLVLGLVMIAIPVISVFQPAILSAIPGVNGLRHPIRAYMLLDVALAILAGIGVARLGRATPARWPFVAVAVLTLGYLVVSAMVVVAPALFEQLILAFWPGLSPRDATFDHTRALRAIQSAWPLVLEAALGVLALLLIGRRWAVPAARLAAVALVTLPLMLLSPNINDRRPLSQFDITDAAWMQTLSNLDPRFVAVVTNEGYQYTNQLALAGIRTPAVFSSLGLAASADLFYQVGHQPDDDLGRAVGVDASVGFGAPCVGREVAFDATYNAHICALDNALHPPYWLPASAVRLDGGTTSPLRPSVARLDVDQVLNGAVPATVLSWADERATIVVQAPAPGYLFIDRSWWPEWQVSVDGAAVTPYSALGGQLISVSAGHHQIEQRYFPWLAMVGGAITLATFFLIVAVPLVRRRRARVPAPANSSATLSLGGHLALRAAAVGAFDRRAWIRSIKQPSHRWLAAGLVGLAVGLPLVIAAWSGALALPHNDDWIYRRLALDLFEKGQLGHGGVAAMLLIGQVLMAQPLLWLSGGAAWSFGLTTAAMAGAGIVAAYSLARRVLPKGRALLAMLCLVLLPGFAQYTSNYMTEIPAWSSATVCLALGVAALGRDGRVRWRLLIAAIAAGLLAFSIRELMIAAPIAVLVAAAVRDTSNLRRYLVAGGVLFLSAGALYLFATRLPGRFAFPWNPLWAENVGLVLHAGPTLALALLPALVLAVGMNLRRWRVLDVVAGVVIGLVINSTDLLAALAGRPFSAFVGNVLLQRGILGSGPLPGLRPLLFPPTWWQFLNVLGLAAAVLACAVIAGSLGSLLRTRAARNRTALAAAVGSPIGLLLVFAILAAGAIVAYGLVATLFDRYLWVLALPLGVLLLTHPPPGVSEPTAGGTGRPWIAASLVLVGVLAATSTVLTMNSYAFDVARWRMGELAVARGFAAETVDAGMEWVGYYGTFPPTPMAPMGSRLMWYHAWWPRFRPCALVSSTPLDWPGTTLEVTVTSAYRLVLLTGQEQPMYLYRVEDPACLAQ